MNTTLFAQGDKRFLSAPECVGIVSRIRQAATGGGETSVSILSQWEGDVRWARNRVNLSADRRKTSVEITRVIEGAWGGPMSCNQIDDGSLHSAVRAAERAVAYRNTQPRDVEDPPAAHTYLKTPIWSDATFAQPAEDRGRIAVAAMTKAEAAGMRSAGYLRLAAEGRAITRVAAEPVLYYPRSYAECSITVRDPTGTGSGWAGMSSYDWARVDAASIAEVALDKCLRSRNPVALEPGRYTAILEPQAVYPIVSALYPMLRSKDWAEQPGQPRSAFYQGPRQTKYNDIPVPYHVSKIGLRLFDERISLSQDPMNPAVGTPPFDGPDDPYRPLTLVENGVLTHLGTNRSYALDNYNAHEGLPFSGSFQMTGGTTSLDEMIATTKRGIIVTRLSSIAILDDLSLLMSAYTRDGLWLIENGKISHPIKNFRVLTSPFFALNNVEQLGTPVPVFSPSLPAVLPALKVRDFNFNSLADAV